jgi:hypothetical protein
MASRQWTLEGFDVVHQATIAGSDRCQGKLLGVGALDQKVDPASTMQVVSALIKANELFDRAGEIVLVRRVIDPRPSS